jgi:nitroimidazol reductase NimA-like FMN-containing flavoprotein (pyridoxamine 5'-phosphate oxidase superfamily)
MTVVWDDETDAILAGDLTAALAYRTPAGGVSVVAVAPVGMRDRDAGVVGFTTSFGFGKKLERIEKDPRIALAFHAREHGLAASPRFVLVQGRARIVADPSPEARKRLEANATALLGSRRTGRFWDWWLHEYYDVRAHILVDVERIVSWPTLDCDGEPAVIGEPWPDEAPAPQKPPQNGTAPRVDADRAAAGLRGLAHTLVGYVGADGRPVVVPVAVGDAGPQGISLVAKRAFPAGGRRAGLLGHSYRPQLVGLETRQHSGWLEGNDSDQATHAPHTEIGYKAPSNKTLLLLANGFLAKRGVRRAGRDLRSGAGVEPT